MRKKIIIGNWKMNPLSEVEAEKIFEHIAKNLPTLRNTEIVICPPVVFLEELKEIRTRKISLGAQDVFYEEKGAFTGQISAEMLRDVGAKYVILGHSERRALGEKNIDINKKIKAVLAAGLVPIVCIGENIRDEDHQYLNVIKDQLETCLAKISKDIIHKIIIAYEPIWALSSTKNRHDFIPAEFLEIKIFIKKVLSAMFGAKVKMPRIIYGGSVRPDNALGIILDGDADGLLPGKDSLDPKKFVEIVKIVENAVH